jgi:Zn-dependent M28 family amino/carboxypeptidase
MHTLVLAIALLAVPTAPPKAAAILGSTPAEKAAASHVTAAEISGHVRFVSDDLLEGRKPGTRGDELAVKYIAAQLEAMGLQPGAPAEGGAPRSFIQSVPLVRLAAKVPEQVVFSHGEGKLPLTTLGGSKADLVLNANAHIDVAQVENADLVFAGYGIVAPEYGWDDYKNVDVKGKIVVLLNFNPPFAGEPDGKRVRLWYGRWDYKYQTAAAHGALGALIVHTTESAGYPWQVLSNAADGVRFDLPPNGEPHMQFQGWITNDAAEKLFALGGAKLDALRAKATGPEAKSFKPVPLELKTSFTMPIERKTIQSANVIGLLPGTDPELRSEAVLFTAHHDHLGTVPPVPPKTDGIYNGALDNASGVAAVLAMAHAATFAPPRRSLYFCFVTAEEQGLLGSRYLAQHPPVPAGRIAADVNIDSFNKFGLTRDVGQLGLGKSSVDEVVRKAAAEQGRSVHGDAYPDRGAFYRSDNFELAKVGVPVVVLKGGPDYLNRPAGWGREQQEKYERENYHQPSDEYRGDWDLAGAIQDAQLDLVVALRIANAAKMPAWKTGDEFEKARKTAAR